LNWERRRRHKHATIKEIVEYGLEKISNKQTITINLKDFMYIYKVLQEYMRFFHNPDHYQEIDDMILDGIFDNPLFPEYYNMEK
jgi:hypothetical protein